MTNGGRSFWVGSAAFTMGALVGAGMGLLLAPQSGARTRRQLQSLAEDAGERAGGLVDEAREAVTQAVDRAKKLTAHKVEMRSVAGRNL